MMILFIPTLGNIFRVYRKILKLLSCKPDIISFVD
jgi:hypothetical protein